MDEVVRARELEIDLGRGLVRRRSEVIPLSPTEWLLLQCLAANAGQVMSTAEVLSAVWGPEHRGDGPVPAGVDIASAAEAGRG